MKKMLQKYVSVILALLVFVSTFSFTIDQHFCGSILVDQSVFSKAKTCGMDMMANSNSSDGSFATSGCCTNKHLKIQGQDELKHSLNTLDFQQQFVLTTFVYSYLTLFESEPAQHIPFQDYVPPLLTPNIQLMDGVFLI